MKLKVLTNIPGTSRSSFGHAYHNDKLYIAGGHPSIFHKYDSTSFSSEFHCLDINLNNWVNLKNLPVPLQGFRLVANLNHIYAFGGFTPNLSINPNPWAAVSSERILKYSIENDFWEDFGAMPRRRSSYVSVTLNDKVYFIGGWDATPNENGDNRGKFVKPIDVFDLTTEKFVSSGLELNRMPLRRALSATVLSQKIIIAGGLGAEGFMASNIFSDVFSYKPPLSVSQLTQQLKGCEDCRSSPKLYDQGEWEQLPFLPTPLFSPGIGVWGEDLIVAGGVKPLFSPYDGASTNEIKILKKGGRNWEDIHISMNESKSFVEVQMLDKSNLLLIGGHRGAESDSLPSSIIEILTRP